MPYVHTCLFLSIILCTAAVCLTDSLCSDSRPYQPVSAGLPASGRRLPLQSLQTGPRLPSGRRHGTREDSAGRFVRAVAAFWETVQVGLSGLWLPSGRRHGTREDSAGRFVRALAAFWETTWD